ncbi:alpha/beta fold hydrolase [Roseovarius faecimaris]|uniref:Alpha/beta fold hydrolase n=1 Tax=Roseovarius faecimaris TaxID=2494550 RepID=A0A6I6IQD4_9RHOB|nr:alpha/beta fold hydrolase [Roseovarius faecimaris]QGX98895.1 alpha/beta fold hydrolase [Roseovarius faecimaris]
MSVITLPHGLRIDLQESGAPDGAALVLVHELGTDPRLWAGVLAQLPPELRVLSLALRGHGRSEVPAPPYAMGALVRDVEALLDHMGLGDTVLAGLGLGGMVAQGLAVKRLDQVRALVLSGTAAKLGRPELWQRRAALALEGGMEAVAEELLPRWTGRKTPLEAATQMRAMLLDCPAQGYAGGAMAIAGTDFYTPTSGLRLPVLGLAGSEDYETPPDLQRETVELIPGARFELLRGAGHLACLEQPEGFAGALTQFLREIGHL